MLADTTASPKHGKVTLVLLCLLAHAILVSITHHHNSPVLDPGHMAGLESSRILIPTGWGGGEPGGDSACLSCSLQRSFVSDLRPIRTSAPIIIGLERRETIPLSCPSTDPCLTVCNRAPPMIVLADVPS